MGLDMFLHAERFLSEYNDADTALLAGANKLVLPAALLGKVNVIRAQASYWRKANAIHVWFVTNCQGGIDDCRSADVGQAQLAELVQLCNDVLDDNDRAAELLPIGAGFFFGSQSYDEWYFDILSCTVDQLTPLLTSEFARWRFTYQSSW